MSESNNDLNHPILNLSPQEKSAFSYLFGLADTDSLNVVTGERAVTFFEKTSVPAPVLGEIWQIADTENRGLLTKPGFCMVLRLIAWYQNGQQHPTTELAFKPGPLPRFDGITYPPSVAQSTASPTTGSFPQGALQPQLSGQSTGGGPIRVPPLDPSKVQQYSGLFARSGAQNGLLDGGTAKSIFEKAGLQNEVLGKIWMLSDREQRGALDETEFIVAMHLLTSMKTRSMTALPNTLPPGLYDAAARRGQRPPSRQMSGVAGPPRTQSPLARPPSTNFQTPQTTGAQWLITPQEKAQYDRFFSSIDTAGQGTLSGEQAVKFFSDSRLSEDTLASIWDLSDINSEGHLNRDEFAVAMYLIRQQRAPNPPPLPAFLPAALVPPNMRSQQQAQQAAPPIQQPQQTGFQGMNQMNQTPVAAKSASEDLFGLDDSPTQTQTQQPTLQPQGTGADPFSGSQTSTPGSPQGLRGQNQAPGGSTTFKPFIPTSAFGASLASQNTGGSTTSSQGQARGFQPQQQGPKAPMPSQMDDLLGDNEAHAEESSKLTNDSTELANMSSQIGNLRTQMEATQTKKTTTQADMDATNAQKTQLAQRLQQFRAQYETEVKTVKEMEQQLTASRESTKKLNQELAMLEGTYQDLQTQHNTISQALQADQQENANLKQRITQINSEVSTLKPQIEKMKLDARQQKGLVSINKKQLATNESERDRLQTEKGDLEREAAEQARSAAASPEPAIASPVSTVASPAEGKASTNPFFRSMSREATSPAPTQGPTPSSFDALFGPSAHFAPTGQATSRSGTPPATSFIGRSVPSVGTAVAAGAGAAALGAAAVGGVAMADSKSSDGKPTPNETPPPSSGGPTDESSFLGSPEAQPPPPSESNQFAPTHLPLGGTVTGPESDAGSSTKVMPPASRAGGIDTPREEISSPPPFIGSAPLGKSSLGQELSKSPEREMVPGAFPDDEGQPSAEAQEVVPGAAAATQGKVGDDFDSAFASFGESEKANEAGASEDPFAPTSGDAQNKGFTSEFPPIQNLEQEDDSESDDDDEPDRGFDDNFTTTSPQHNGVAAAATTAAVASSEPSSSAQPTASDLPDITKETSPPTYEQSDNVLHGGSGERTESNQFDPKFSSLLPSREDPTSPPPPDSSAPASSSVAPPVENPEDEITPAPLPAEERPAPSNLMAPPFGSAAKETIATPNTDVFVDASSRPTSSVPESAFGSLTQTAAAPPTSTTTNVFDEFDDFGDLSEAKEADRSAGDDFAFGRPSHDEFNPAFDSPAPSQTQTPMRSIPQSQQSNGFSNFTPNASTSVPAPFASGSDSIQQTPSSAQHDWDAIFSGLDNSKGVDTSLGKPSTSDPWGSMPAATTNGSGAVKEDVPAVSSLSTSAAPTAKAGDLGRAITPGTEHDDPILKRLTGMGYARSDALNALEMYDYDINKAVDHLAGN